jgi:hypothetical protein
VRTRTCHGCCLRPVNPRTRKLRARKQSGPDGPGGAAPLRPPAIGTSPERDAGFNPILTVVPPNRRGWGRPRKTREQTRSSHGENDWYCICQGPDDEKPVIQSDVCNGWFHCWCMGVTQEDIEGLDRYICPLCLTLCSSRPGHRARALGEPSQ